MFDSYQAAGSLFPEVTWLQQQLEEMLQPASVSGIRSLARGAFPAINVGTTADAVEVIAFVPGVDPKTIDITIERGSQRQPGANAYAKERFVGKFRRVISLPEDADPTRVEARSRDGILQVTVAKRESSKPGGVRPNRRKFRQQRKARNFRSRPRYRLGSANTSAFCRARLTSSECR
jgi:HSP20 family protein